MKEKHFTPRQRSILELVARGMTNQQIADRLYLSVKTVKNHRYRLCKMLDLSGYGALYRYALEWYNGQTGDR